MTALTHPKAVEADVIVVGSGHDGLRTIDELVAPSRARRSADSGGRQPRQLMANVT